MTDGETEGGQENISDSPLVIQLVNSKAGTDFRYFYAMSGLFTMSTISY